MKIEPCPKCGSTNRERGEVFPKGTLWDVRFKSAESFGLSFKKKVAAIACPKCGYIEFYLAAHDDT
jgi:predicted nucleic-acid-binding Zn-ribbon protein